MSRSYRKAYYTITKRWDKFNEHAYRHRVKQVLQQPFDPDKDWVELCMSQKGLADYGTKYGFAIIPDAEKEPEDYNRYKKAQRK